MNCQMQLEKALPVNSKSKRVAILIAVYNGEAFLERQFETLARQSVSSIDLWISDDGSKDGSREIVRKVAEGWGKGNVHQIEGPGQGFAENFRSLLTNPEIEADYFAFCDQDDLWDDDKLAIALEWLKTQRADVPALFCSRTKTITAEGESAGYSPLFRKKPSFRNAIVQSIAGGNTMVMNRAARSIMLEASRRTEFVSHDWWCYLIVTGVGGVVHYSPTAKIGYRQHPSNLVGENNSWRARMFRVGYLMKGRFMHWNDRNLAGLATCVDILSPEARETMQLFLQARSSSFLFTRLSALIRAGVYRQTLFGHIGLYVACILKRL
jgi:glycosyltransferase involved in cell wall biosynthesis